ncbi:hypothetical protein [Bremerella cremea]|uniref:hypothetical protein n=1 Tax=Bremerella cremea TaxID=1031537 RepID=UPI0031EEA291
MSRKKRTERSEPSQSLVGDASLCVWLLIAGAVIYAYWYFSLAMPWPAPGPGETPYHPTRGDLVRDGLLLLPELLSLWWGGGEMPLGIFDRVGILAGVVAMLLFAYALGEFLLCRLKLLKFFGRIDGAVLRLGIGLTLLSWSTCILGLCGLLQRPLAIVLSLAILFVSLGTAWKKQLARGSDPSEATAPSSVADFESRWWLLATAPLLLFIVGVSIVPPYEYDVVEYHLEVPKQWYQAGEVSVLPGNVYSGMPMGAEMWALLSMIFVPSESAWFYGALIGKTVMGLFTVFIAGLLYGAGKRLVGPWCGRAAALSAIAVPWLTYQSGTGLVDGVWAFFTLAAAYPVLIVMTTDNEKRSALPLDGLAILSGLMAGMAFGVKYPALLLAIVPVFGLWVYAARTDWKVLGLQVAAVLVMTAPWLVKNTIDTGNPVYPLAGNLFPTDIRTADQIAQWNQAHQVPTNAEGSRYSISQLMHGVTTLIGGSPWAGLAIVPLAICGLFSPQRRLVVPVVILLAVCWLVWWGMSHRLERFLIPAIPLGCLLAGIGAEMVAPYALGRYALRAWLGLGLLVGFVLVNQSQAIKLDPRIFVSLESLANSHTAQGVQWLNEHVPPGDAVLATGDAALFYLEPPVMYHTCFDDPPFQPLVKMTADERRAWLAERDIGWLYVHWGEIERFRSLGNYGFPRDVTREFFSEMENQGIIEVTEFQTGNPDAPTVVIYRVHETNQP